MGAQAEFAKRLHGTNGQRIYFTAQQKKLIAINIAKRWNVDPASLKEPQQEQVTTRRASVEAILRDVSSDGRLFNFICSTAEVDRSGDSIAVGGWQLANYRRNPILLWAHDSSSVPVGKAVSIGTDGGQLTASFKFANTRFGKAIAELVSDGFVRATSVGFKPLAFTFSKDPARRGGLDFAKQELLEVSIVPIPCNQSCLLQSITGTDGKSLNVARRAARERDIEIMRLRHLPLSRAEQRALDIARMRAKP
jgi:HK97 family phage prohead protease